MEMALLGPSAFSFLISGVADIARLKLAKLRGLARLAATGAVACGLLGLLCLLRKMLDPLRRALSLL